MTESKKSDENAEDSSGVKSESIEECLGKSLETLSTAFMASARRWETIVYPSLFAFILLSSYGFYLIYNLTSDVSKMAEHMGTIATNMNDITQNMNVVSQNMVLMTQTIDSQSSSMHEMTMHMRHMSISMGQMRYDMSIMNNSISRPMSFMNTFMPW